MQEIKKNRREKKTIKKISFGETNNNSSSSVKMTKNEMIQKYGREWFKLCAHIHIDQIRYYLYKTVRKRKTKLINKINMCVPSFQLSSYMSTIFRLLLLVLLLFYVIFARFPISFVRSLTRSSNVYEYGSCLILSYIFHVWYLF